MIRSDYSLPLPAVASRRPSRTFIAVAMLAGLALQSLAAPATAGVRDDLLAQYAASARAADPAFAGFSAERGRTLHQHAFAGGKPETPACTSCHGKDVRGPGRTPAGKSIEAVAISATPSRYADPAKVE